MNYSEFSFPACLLAAGGLPAEGHRARRRDRRRLGRPEAHPRRRADNSAPVAIVNGTPISRQLFEFYAKGSASKKSYADLTPEQKAAGARQSDPRAGRGAGGHKRRPRQGSATCAPILVLSQSNVLQQALSDRYLKDKKPTEQEARAEYETQVGLLPQQEYHVSTSWSRPRPSLRKIIAELDKGGNFAEIAKRESMDPSKTNGGDIGWLTPDRMMKPFADAMVSLKKGEYTHKPVQTQYGWHVIRRRRHPRRDTARLRSAPGPAAPRAGRAGKEVQGLHDGLMKNAQIEKKL